MNFWNQPLVPRCRLCRDKEAAKYYEIDDRFYCEDCLSDRKRLLYEGETIFCDSCGNECREEFTIIDCDAYCEDCIARAEVAEETVRRAPA